MSSPASRSTRSRRDAPALLAAVACPAAPLVSVIVPCYNSATTLDRCLLALDRQRTRHAYDVVVVDSSDDGACEAVARRYPHVRLVRLAERAYPGGARNVGVAASTGDILAFTDADCSPAADWISEIVAAHGSGAALVGGAIDNGNPESLVSWAHYLSEFGRWMPGGGERVLPDLATGCLSMRRWLFEQCGPFLDGTYSSDTDFCWKAGDGGHASRFLPTMRVRHVHVTDPRELLRRNLVRGKAFARVRTRSRGLSRLQAAARALSAPALPPLLFARLLREVWRRRRYRREVVLAAPLVAAVLVAWSLGEAVGYAESVRRSEE